MADRSLLGAADVDDAALAVIVRRSLGVDEPVQVVQCEAEVVAYDLDALTTGGRFWVRGLARTATGDRPFCLFVKVVQSWARSPMFAVVPPELRATALAQLPWQAEPLVYRSDLASRLPAGLAMPAAYAVVDLDDESAALWLQAIDVVATPWDVDRLAVAARLLGRLAASRQVRPLARLARDSSVSGARLYAGGRVTHQVLPALRDDALWRHPLLVAAFDARLRHDLLAAADRLWSIVAELEQMPVGTAHGDACPRNLLVQRDATQIALIDYAFWGVGPLGWDLGQLLIGEVQLGERPASTLPALRAACLPAYVDGLRAEGCTVPQAVVHRAHALQMLLFSGLSAIPFEHLGQPPTPELHRIASERAAMARFILDEVAATG